MDEKQTRKLITIYIRDANSLFVDSIIAKLYEENRNHLIILNPMLNNITKKNANNPLHL